MNRNDEDPVGDDGLLQPPEWPRWADFLAPLLIIAAAVVAIVVLIRYGLV